MRRKIELTFQVLNVVSIFLRIESAIQKTEYKFTSLVRSVNVATGNTFGKMKL